MHTAQLFNCQAQSKCGAEMEKAMQTKQSAMWKLKRMPSAHRTALNGTENVNFLWLL
jgi:hypothetical protein